MKSLQAHPKIYPHIHPHPQFNFGEDILFSILWIILVAGVLFSFFKFLKHKTKKG
jgi:hypothetical protein